MSRKTTARIQGDKFMLNGQLTYAGRTYNGQKVEGLLMNARLVQGIFDDLNPETRARWNYPDGKPFDAERNTTEFLQMMPTWRKAGLLSFTINLQGGSPQGYSKEQPWHNSAFTEIGDLRPDYMARLERILDRADELGMVVILGYFYFGQDHRLRDEAAVLRATDNATDWVLQRKYTHLLIDIANECDIHYVHPLIRAPRNHELIERVRERSQKKLMVGTSLSGGKVPPEAIVAASNFVLLHGNGVREPDHLRKLIDDTRAVKTFQGQPVLVNEDDHFDFDKPDNNFRAALSRYVSWGYFDFRMAGEGFAEGYQSVPVDWGIRSERKRGFFRLLAEITGGTFSG